MSLLPLVTCTSISSSPSSILIALMPVVRGFEYCDSAVFFTVPCLVANSRNSSSENSRTGTIAWMRVSGETLIRLTIGLPLRRAAGLRDLVHLEPVAAPVVGEDQHVVVRAGDEQVLDEVLVLERPRRSARARRAAAAGTS